MAELLPSTSDRTPHATQYWTVSPRNEHSGAPLSYTATADWTFHKHVHLLTWPLVDRSVWALFLFGRRSKQFGHEGKEYFEKVFVDVFKYKNGLRMW